MNYYLYETSMINFKHMKNFIKLTALFTVIAIFSACGDTSSNTESTNDSDSIVTVRNVNDQPVEDIEKGYIINWKFEEIGETEFGSPITKVIMNVDGMDIILIEELELSCSQLSDEEYALYRMPDKVLSGFLSWWAGGGYYFYVILEQDKMVVMRALVDESMPHDDLVYETFKEIPVSELN